jgi:iron complex outermembrane receptor protein
VVSIFGNPALKSEEMRAFEFGYRSQLHSRITVDLATFYNAYDRLVNLEPRSPFLEADQFPPRLVLPNFFGNNIRGETYGAEISANLELTRRWQVRGNYTLLRMQLHRKPNSHDLTAESIEGDNPRHQVQFHSYFNLPRNFEIDAAFYHVGALPGPLVPRYNRLDLRLGWRLRDGLAFSFGGQNLLDAQHPEFNGTTVLVNTSQIRRGVFGKLTWVR